MIEPVILVDAAAREIALDTGTSFIVQAPAGSGKTELLTRRFLRLLAEVDSPDQILAITFTRSATAEMRRRILGAMEAARDGTDDSDKFKESRELALAALLNAEKQGWDIFRNPHLLRIETIDSFCLSLAHRTPLLSRLGGTFQPTEIAEPLYDIAAQRTLRMLGGPDAALNVAISTLLRVRDNGLAECAELIASMLARRDQWSSRFVLDTSSDWQDQVRSELEKPMKRAITRTLNQLNKMFVASAIDGTQFAELASFACANLRLESSEPCRKHLAKIATLDLYKNLPSFAAEDLNAWKAIAAHLLTGGGDWRKSINKQHGFPPKSKTQILQLQEIIQHLQRVPGLQETLYQTRDLPPAAYSDDQWSLLSRLFLTLRAATAQLKVVFAERNAVDFIEIGLAAEQVLKLSDELLGDLPSELALSTSEQLRHLLVDEFQDTSRRQHRLLSMLVRAWSADEGRTCFLVGDPMQSIYLFRQAEVELFQHAKKHGLGSGDESLPLESLQLTTNFRSHRGLVDRLNAILEPVFLQDVKPDAASVVFTPSEAYEPELVPNSVEIHANLIPPQDSREQSRESRSRAQEVEANQVLEIVRSHRTDISNNNRYIIAILARARNHLLPIAAALRRNNIVFRAVEMENLGERQEVVDLQALLRALLHPMDRVAWLAVLRAPWCGLTLADLHKLTGEDDRTFRKTPVLELLRTRLSLLSEEGQQRAGKTLAVLEEAIRQRQFQSSSQSLSTLVERTWYSLGGRDCVDKTAYENTQVYFDMLDKISADGISCINGELEQNLTRLFAQPDSESSEFNGVQLMTIHKAKGLGFDVVIVPGLHRATRPEQSKLLTWLERSVPPSETAEANEVSEVLVAPICEKGEESNSLTKWVEHQEKARLDEEQKRLFYVACTRAGKELHLLGTSEIKASTNKTTGEITYSLKRGDTSSLLQTAWPGLDADFQQSLETWKQKNAALAATSGVTTMPLRESYQPETLFDLAAAEERPATLRRLPDNFVPDRFRGNVTIPDTDATRNAEHDLFDRPSGSLRVRAFGVAVHALLDRASRKIQAGATVAQCQKQLPPWTAATANLLQQQGLSRAESKRLSLNVISAVNGALEDETGRWILSPHHDAQNEAEWTGWLNGTLRNIRVDRVFRAGEEVSAPGDNIYWIIDYKTSTHSALGLESFFQEQKEEYKPQLEAYAAVLRLLKGPGTRIRLGLYYPLLHKLESWFY
jgi:ATP-dependent helicase/nuclease subunit A